LDAAIVGETIAKQLEARINYRRALKWLSLLLCVWVQKESRSKFRVVLVEQRWLVLKNTNKEEHLYILGEQISTTALSEALTVYGKLGIKVWVCKGEIYGKKELVSSSSLEQGATGPAGQQQGQGGRDGGRQPRRDGGRARAPKK
jgi:small subunit ribosomal protein S3